ncbi:MAG TPA: sugar ABC transporter ATP-binding protein [Ktedonobacteraceae bacterium]|nr:sugar ABC transporter ATP-binding protein [Ktedonobacteraceae bacterium]
MFEIQSVSKVFPGVRALDEVSMHLRPGEIHGLIGENGAGKSTLIKIITGLHRPDGGRLLLDGVELHLTSPRAAIKAGIGAVHQERNLIPRFTIAENMLLERLPARMGVVNAAALKQEALHWLRKLNLSLDPAMEVARLSVAQAQLVEIAKALTLESRILLLDEPTASITPAEAEHLFTIFRALRDQGVALLFVSHKLEEIFSLCDHLTVLRDGKAVVVDQEIAALDRDQVLTAMIGRAQTITDLPPRVVDTTQVVLEGRELSTAQGHARVNFSLHRGEILGLYGLVGAGRSELARALIGLEPITAGSILVNGRRATPRGVRQAKQKYQIGYVTENRKEEGLFLILDVATNVAATVWERLSRFLGLIPRRAERQLARTYVDRLGIKVSSVSQQVGTLSGGNQQKVSLAKWLAADCAILIIDEPTIGIDIRTKDEFHQVIWQLASEGKSILLISSDMPEMIHLADRILVMNDMQLVGEMHNSRNYEEMSQAIIQTIHAHPGRTAEVVQEARHF